MIDSSQRKAAKVFGITYLLTFVIITVAFFRFYAPLLVGQNSAQTARNIATHQQAFRIYLAGTLIYGIGLVVILAALYMILRPMSRGLALFAMSTRLVYASLWFVTMVLSFNALRLLGSADQSQSLAGLQLASSMDAYYIGLTFYGLGSIVFAYLWYKSRYIPRTVAVWGMLSSAFEGFCAFAYLISPGFGNIISPNWYELPIVLFELATCGWILVRGLREPVMTKVAQAGS